MRRTERGATATAMFAVDRVATRASSPADNASISILSSAIRATAAVVAILGVLLLIGPAVLLAGDVAGLLKKHDTTAALGGPGER